MVGEVTTFIKEVHILAVIDVTKHKFTVFLLIFFKCGSLFAHINSKRRMC